ncbi:MAG: B12-binding domain-containing radical SAM protein [Actinomycetota bacterium]|nr:B12-binding domain-containing radical SAM protein [Actinomycetota bacterium]
MTSSATLRQDMTGILLAHSYFLRLDPKQWEKMRPYPPLGTLYAAGVLRDLGHEVAVFDAMLAEGEHEFEHALRAHQPCHVVLYEDNFNFLSKMCLARMREAALAMVTMAKAVGCRVAVAGADVTDHADVYLAGGADVCILGEGDHTVVEVIDAWNADAHDPSYEGVHGIATLSRGSVCASRSRSIERHPDVFGRPARDLIDIEAYRRAWVDHHSRFSLNMVSTRGCPYRCNWCAKPIWGQRYAMRTPDDVAEELATVKAEIRPDHIWFADDIFGLRSDWLALFARRVNELDAVIPFTMQSRCDLMTPVAVRALASAGCDEVWLGAESGSQRVLDAMDKEITVDDIRSARLALAEVGVRACLFIQFGYPGETWDDIERTISMVQELLPDDIGVSVSYPLPGTRFHEMVKFDLEDRENWQDSGDLAMMFAGTYSTQLYRLLHLALHDDLDMRRRLAGLQRAQHPLIPEVTLDEQCRRVEARWAEVREVEVTSRHPNPTRLRIPIMAIAGD